MSFYKSTIHYYPHGLGMPAIKDGRRKCDECKTQEMRFILRGHRSLYLCPLCLVAMLANKPLSDYWTLPPWRADNVRLVHLAEPFGRTELHEV